MLFSFCRNCRADAAATTTPTPDEKAKAWGSSYPKKAQNAERGPDLCRELHPHYFDIYLGIYLGFDEYVVLVLRESEQGWRVFSRFVMDGARNFDSVMIHFFVLQSFYNGSDKCK